MILSHKTVSVAHPSRAISCLTIHPILRQMTAGLMKDDTLYENEFPPATDLMKTS